MILLSRALALGLFAASLASAQTIAPLAGIEALSDSLRSASSPHAQSEVLRLFFDGEALSSRRFVSNGEAAYKRLREAKALLSVGPAQEDGSSIQPFVFRLRGGESRTAPAAGLEGFVYAERRIALERGTGSLAHHLKDYASYLDALLGPVSWAADARREVEAVMSSGGSDTERYNRLIAFTRRFTEELRAAVAGSDKAAWVRDARIYEIFPRAYNLKGKREALGQPAGPGGLFFADFGTRDLLDIRAQGFDSVWVMGIFPIGRRNAFGTAGGSPYSVKDHEGLHPDLGTREDFRAFVKRAHAAGLKVIIDFIPNHTSMDSKLLMANPDFFIHRRAGPGPIERGYFTHTDPGTGDHLWVRHGGYDSYGDLSFWEDTAQVDYSKEAARREMVRIVRDWAGRTGVDGFRVDMAYQVLNSYFSRNWRLRMPPREFLEELITSVKAAYPGTAFIAEGYDGWDALSACGFDLIYGKNNMARPGGHHGWYDALVSRDPGWIREAIKRAEFLQWQKGGSDMMNFIGNHDEHSPGRAFGPWERGAAFLTLMMPGSQLFYGSQEIGYDRPDPNEQKSIPFSVPRSVDWKNVDPETVRFYRDTFSLARRWHERLIAPRMKALTPSADGGWAGYALLREGAATAEALVLSNPGGRAVTVEVKDSALGFEWRGELPPYGYRLVELSGH